MAILEITEKGKEHLLAIGDGTTLSMRKHYVFKHYPEAYEECMPDSDRYVVRSMASSKRITLGTGSTLDKAWSSAYEYTLSHPVSTPKFSSDVYTEGKYKTWPKTAGPIPATVEFSPGKIIPIDTKKYPILMMKTEEEFKPVDLQTKLPSSIAHKADLTNQSLVQHIGVASNCNVILQQAYSIKGEFGRKVRLVCKKCNKDRVYYNEKVFHMTMEGIVDELKGFCFEHRHDGGKVHMPWNTVAVPDPVEVANYRKFREA